MLSAVRHAWLVFALLALAALSSAMSLEEALRIDGIEAYLHHGVKRQGASGTGNTAATEPTEPTPTPTEDAPSQEPTSTPEEDTPTPTPPPTPLPTPTSTEDPPSEGDPESTPPPASSAAPTSRGGRSSAAPGSSPAQSTSASSKITTPILRTSDLVSTSTEEFTTTYTTVSDGQSIPVTSTGTNTALITTGQVVQTTLPEPQDGGDGGGGGLSDTNKKVIGGVVGGVGGAILLGGIAIICWRIWGRKKHVSEDDDDLMAGTGSALGDKPQNAGSPFQSNLEQYHNPGGRPNAAANF